MWELNDPKPVKLIVGILAADRKCLCAAVDAISTSLGSIDLQSDMWTFDQTDYYKEQTGQCILRQFVSLESLIDPGGLAGIKHTTNRLEQDLARSLASPFPRPVNLDPGIIEPSKLVVATTKDYSHRIYIGEKMFAEVTLIYDKGRWMPLQYTYPDYRQQCYHDFFTKVRTRLLEQLRSWAMTRSTCIWPSQCPAADPSRTHQIDRSGDNPAS
jgi:hypothetical protein